MPEEKDAKIQALKIALDQIEKQHGRNLPTAETLRLHRGLAVERHRRTLQDLARRDQPP